MNNCFLLSFIILRVFSLSLAGMSFCEKKNFANTFIKCFLVLISLFLIQPNTSYSFETCDKHELANLYYDLDHSGVIDSGDAFCLNHYVINGSTSPLCPYTTMDYYDINFDCPANGGQNCINNLDVALMAQYLDPNTRDLALANMQFIQLAYSRRKCDNPPILPCNADNIAKSMFNFYKTDNVLDNKDLNCMNHYVATLPLMNPQLADINCHDTFHTTIDYSPRIFCRLGTCTSVFDLSDFNQYLLGGMSALDLNAVSTVWNLHCTGAPNTPPTLTFPVSNLKYYWMANSNGGQFNLRSEDPDGDDIQFSVSPMPPPAKLSPNNGLITGPEIEKSATFLWSPIPESAIGDHYFEVKANDGTEDSNVATNILGRVAAYSEKYTDPQNGNAPMTYTYSGGIYTFDKPIQEGQLFEMDVELSWLPTPEMWNFLNNNQPSCPTPMNPTLPVFDEMFPGNSAKARLSFTPGPETPEGYINFCPTFLMVSGGGWLVNGRYHKRFRFNYAPLGMTLNTSPPQEEQLAYVDEPKIIHLSSINGTPNYTYDFSYGPAAPAAVMEMSDPDSYTFYPAAINNGVTYNVIFESSDSTTPIPQTVNKTVKITVTDLKLTEP